MTRITLATLPQATEQEVFTQVATHLLTQKRKSLKPGTATACLYRGENNTMCAAGCLISDEEFEMFFGDCDNGSSWAVLIAENIVPSSHDVLIADLQNIHDQNMPDTWLKLLTDLAYERMLEMPVVAG